MPTEITSLTWPGLDVCKRLTIRTCFKVLRVPPLQGTHCSVNRRPIIYIERGTDHQTKQYCLVMSERDLNARVSELNTLFTVAVSKEPTKNDMDSLKELLTPKTFNRLSFVTVICWIIFGVVLLGIFADIENGESRFDFRCDAKASDRDLIQGKCFENYGKRYNKFSLPLYGFVIINFSIIAIVCVLYSQTVKSRVSELKCTRNRDAEGQFQQGKPIRRWLFVVYCCQLLTRFVLAILFIVLQTQLFYPRNFPSSYQCTLPMMKESGANNSNSASAYDNSSQTQVYQCHNRRAAKRNFWTDAVSAMNGLFVLIILIELICMFSRARKGKIFMEDSQFIADHLNNDVSPRKRELLEIQERRQPLRLLLENVSQGKLHCLDLSGDNVADAGVMQLCEALTNFNCQLSSLNLSWNSITDEGAVQLSRVLAHSDCKLGILNLYGNCITDAGAVHLSKALTHDNCKLSDLNLSGNNLTIAGLILLSKALTHINCKLNMLNLYGNSITDAGAMHLSKALTHSNCKLNSLNLSSNSITDSGLMHLIEALKHSYCKLSSLNLNGNSITDAGVEHLSKALTHTDCKLNILNLSGNSLTDAGVMHLSRAIIHFNCKLSDLDVSCNSITDAGVMYLTKALTNANYKLRSLNLSSNCITDGGAMSLSKALTQSNCKLSYLNLLGNCITDASLVHLTEALLRSNCKLSELNLNGNNIAESNIAVLYKTLDRSEPNC